MVRVAHTMCARLSPLEVVFRLVGEYGDGVSRLRVISGKF